MSDSQAPRAVRLGYKLFRLKADGSLGSLFIDRRRELPVGEWLCASDVPTKGYKHRPGWHVMEQPIAPHLSEKGRVWRVVLYAGVLCTERRPESQGGVWHTARLMLIVPGTEFIAPDLSVWSR